MNHRRITTKVAQDFLDAYRKPHPTLWYENAAGDKIEPDLQGDFEPPPPGFIYQHSMFPTQLSHNILYLVQSDEVLKCPHPPEHVKDTNGWIDGVEGRECKQCNGSQMRDVGNPWPVEWEASGSRDFMRMEMGWQEEVVLGLVAKGFSLKDAIIISARSCERCMNAVAHAVGVEWGYPAYGEDWQKCGTVCDYCEQTKTAGVKDVLNKIIQRIRDPLRKRDMGQKVLDYSKSKRDRDDLSLQESGILYRPDNYSDTLPLSKKKKLDIGWTDHAEYRSDLRDFDPKNVNEAIRDILKQMVTPQKGKKPNLNPSQPQRLKMPGLGTLVVDYNLKKNPADAKVITLWATNKRAYDMESGTNEAHELVKLAKAVLSANKKLKTLKEAKAALKKAGDDAVPVAYGKWETSGGGYSKGQTEYKISGDTIRKIGSVWAEGHGWGKIKPTRSGYVLILTPEDDGYSSAKKQYDGWS